MTVELLHEAGAALYGPRWQSELARALGVSDRTMRRWAAGGDQPPHGVAGDILTICLRRRRDLDALMMRLKNAKSPAPE